MLHLSSSTIASQLRLDPATPKTSRLAALVTKYYSPGEKEEVLGWRRPIDTESGNLSVQTSRPYTIRSRGQWTSQPRYPHTKIAKTASQPKLKQSQEKLVKAALKPSVGELAWEHETGTETAKLYLPPLRHLDNSASHHDHPAPIERPLIVVAEKDAFPTKAPKPAKSKARGRTKTITSPVEARLVKFPKPTHYCFSPPTEEPPIQEKFVLALVSKPVAAPEKRVRQFRSKEPASNHQFEKSVSREEEESPEAKEDQFEQSEGSLFSYSDQAEDSDQLIQEYTPFPDLQPSPTQEDSLSTPAQEAGISLFLDVKITPIHENVIPLDPGNLRTLDDKSDCFQEPLPALFDHTNEETDRGTKWTSVSTMENSLGQAIYVEDRSIEDTHERVNTEVSLESFEAASSGFASNIQIVDSITVVCEADKEEDFHEKPASQVLQAVHVAGLTQVSKPDASPRLKKAMTLELPPLPSQPRQKAPATVLSASQLADLEPRMQKGKKKPPPLIELETRTTPQARKTRKEATSRRLSLGSPITKKSKTASKSSKAEVFDFNREVSKPLDMQIATLTHSNSAVEGEDYLVIQEQAGEESEEEGGDSSQISKPSVEAPMEEIKKAVSLSLYRRGSGNLEGIMRRGSTQADPSLEEEPLNKSASIVDASTPKAGSSKASRKGGKRFNKTTQPTRRQAQKKTASYTVPPETKVTVTSPEESPMKLIRTVSVEASAPPVALKHSAQSSLSSSSESSDSEEAEDPKPGTEAGKAKGNESKSRRKRTTRLKSKTKDTKTAGKRGSIFSADRSDYGSESDFSNLPRQPADEVFVRHFALNMLGFMHSIAPKRSPQVTRGLNQLTKVRKEVLSIGYGVLGGEAQRRASILARRRTSTVDINRPKRLRRSITSVALAGLKENLDHALNTSEDDAASDDSVGSAELRLSKFSRAEFEIKHMSMLKSLAMRLLNLGQFTEVEEAPAVPQLTPGERWEQEYRDHRQTVSHTLDSLFKDFKSGPITAFTSVVTNFFRDPQAMRNAAEENEELEKVEINTENYREELERRKFKEYSRQWTAYEVMRLTQPESMHQVTNERLNPQELSSYFRSMMLKRKRRRLVLEGRNGTQPAVLKAKPRTTDTGLLLDYYEQQVRAARKAELPRDVVLSGGAHQVQSQEEYQERVYCRLKHEKNLQKFSHPPKHGT